MLRLIIYQLSKRIYIFIDFLGLAIKEVRQIVWKLLWAQKDNYAFKS